MLLSQKVIEPFLPGRDQTRAVNLKQVNRVLIQPYWSNDCDSN